MRSNKCLTAVLGLSTALLLWYSCDMANRRAYAATLSRVSKV